MDRIKYLHILMAMVFSGAVFGAATNTSSSAVSSSVEGTHKESIPAVNEPVAAVQAAPETPEEKLQNDLNYAAVHKLGGRARELELTARFYIDSEANKLPDLPILTLNDLALDLKQFLKNNKGKIAVVPIDLQKDFASFYANRTPKGGRLAVPVLGDAATGELQTDQDYIQKTIQATKFFASQGLPIIGTLDSHPQNHVSFASNNIGKEAFDGSNKPIGAILPAKEAPQLQFIFTHNDKIQSGFLQEQWSDHCVRTLEKSAPNYGGIQTFIPWDYYTISFPKGTNEMYDSYSGVEDKGGELTGLVEYLLKNGITHVIVYGLATDYCVKDTVIHLRREGIEVMVISELCRAAFSTSRGEKEMSVAGAVILPKLTIGKLR